MPDEEQQPVVRVLGIEIRGVYDGVSAWKMSDGSYVNRWEPGTRMYDLTQEWIKSVDRND